MILWMLKLVLTISLVRSGSAPHYNKNVMERVAANRGMDVVDCMVSSPYEEIGTWLYVESETTGYAAMCRVTDVSAPQDRARHIAKGYALEFGFESAKQFCGITKVGQEPPWKCKVRVWR